MYLALELLENMLAEGFCLHGSKRRISDHLIPHQAHCESGRPEGNLNAIYADPDGVRIPCLMALFDRKDPRQSRMTSYTGQGGGMLTVEGTNTTFTPGYVYVLPTDTFVFHHGEFVSFTPVWPHAIVPVTPEILWPLLARGNLDLQIPIPAPW